MEGGNLHAPACGFAVFFEDAVGDIFFHGMFGSLISTEGRYDDFLGTERCTSGASEINGMTWVILWLLQAPQKRFVVYYDCQYAAQVVTARATPLVNKPLVTFAAGIMAYATRLKEVTTQHVYSHRGHAWNELADLICTCTSLRGVGFGAPWFIPASVRQIIRGDVKSADG